MQLNITDGGNNLLASLDYQLKWGQSALASQLDTKLPYDINVDFLESTSDSSKMAKRIVGPTEPITIDWEAWILSITAGSTAWTDKDTDTSTLPYCKVGGWDNGNFWDWLDSVVSLGGDEHLPVSIYLPSLLLTYTNFFALIESTNGLSLGLLIAFVYYGFTTMRGRDLESCGHFVFHFSLQFGKKKQGSLIGPNISRST